MVPKCKELASPCSPEEVRQVDDKVHDDVLVVALLFLLSSQRTTALKRTRSLPPQFLCPITGEIMREPVTTADGHVFERTAIERWLKTHSTSPMTGMSLEHTSLAPAHALRQLIESSQGRRQDS